MVLNPGSILVKPGLCCSLVSKNIFFKMVKLDGAKQLNVMKNEMGRREP